MTNKSGPQGSSPLERPDSWPPGRGPQHGASPAPPGSPGRRSRRILVVSLVSLLLLSGVAVAAWFLAVRPAPTASTEYVVEDMRTLPEKTWTYEFAPHGDEQWIEEWPTILNLGGDRFAVLAALDRYNYSQQNASAWYEGYDEHYATGYADGVRYGEAYQAYYDDGTDRIEDPDRADFFSLEGVTYDVADSFDEFDTYRGWADGFSDGEDGMAEGSNSAEQPDTLPTFGHVSVIDSRTGQEIWSVGLEDFGVASPEWETSLVGPSPEGHITLAVVSPDDEAMTVLHALSPIDGSEVSRVEFPHIVETAVNHGEATSPLVSVSENSVSRWDTSDLGGDPVWTALLDPSEPGTSTWTEAGYVVLHSQEAMLLLDAETGVPPPWFAGVGSSLEYQVLEDVVLRIDESGSGQFVDGVDAKGRTLWSGEAEEFLSRSGSGGEVLLRAKDNREFGFDNLMRRDPLTGEPMWDSEYSGDPGYVIGTVPGSIVLESEGSTEIVDIHTGERRHRLPGVAELLGTTVVYGDDGDDESARLRAWDVRDGSELWSMPLSESEAPSSVGDLIIIRDQARRSISLLREN